MKSRISITLVLIALTLAAVAYLVINTQNRVSNVVDHGLLLPDLIDQLNDIAEIQINSSQHTSHLMLDDGDWLLSEFENYPARSDLVSNFLVGLAQLRLIEPKTNDPSKFDALDLAGPDVDNSSTLQVSLLTKDGQNLVNLFIGKRRQSLQNILKSELYLRKPSENQTWLAQSALSIPSNSIDWLDTEIINLDERIDQVSIQPHGKLPYMLAREPADVENFYLVDLPENHKIRYRFRLNDIGEFFRRLKFEDVKQYAKEVTGATIIARTSDGLEISAKFGQGELSYFAQFSAVATDDATSVTKNEARELNRQWSGWLYRVSDVRREIANLTFDDLIEPVNGNIQTN